MLRSRADIFFMMGPFMSEKKRIIILIVIMAAVAFISVGVAVWLNYRIAFEEEKLRLKEAAQSQARLIEAIARFDRDYNIDFPGGPEAATISKIVDAHDSYRGFGKTGEFYIARIEDEKIVFLMSHRLDSILIPDPIPITTEFAEPIRLALSGLSGTMIGYDYRGEKVLAAHEPVDMLRLGIVAKIDLKEIRSPFIKSGLITAGLAILIALIGALMFVRVARPILKSISEKEERYLELVETMNDGFAVADEKDVLTYVNHKLCEMFGHSLEEMIGHRVTDFIHEPDRKKYHNQTAEREKGIPGYYEIALKKKDGSTAHAVVAAKPLFGSLGKYEGFSAVITDITERKLVEDEIRRLNLELEQKVKHRTAKLEAANKELEAFSYSVSHDLKAPLRAIQGFSNILAEEHSKMLDKEGHRILRVVVNNTKTMGRLIDDLLALSRVSTQEKRVAQIDMTKLVKDVQRGIMKDVPKRTISWRIQDLPVVEIDYSLMRQAWTNLLSNSIKFTRPKKDALIEVGFRVEKKEHVFYVKDNGVGFDPRYVGKLFEVFQRLHSSEEFEGTGIGLALVKRIIHRHNGRLWAEGEEGKGATFYFTLPGKKEKNNGRHQRV